MNQPDIYEVIDGLGVASFKGLVYRHVAPGIDCLSDRGALFRGGRWNPPTSFPVIYTALTPESAAAEFYRMAERNLIAPPDLLPRTLCIIQIDLRSVLDLRPSDSLSAVGLDLEDVRGDDMGLCQRVGEATHKLGLEGLLGPSATGTGEILTQIKSMAFEVEYVLKPVVLADVRISPDLVKMHVDDEMEPFSLDEPFDNPQKWPVYGGMDVGKSVNPSHITVFVEHPKSGHLVQVYEAWLDHMSYGKQAKLVNKIIAHFGIWKFLYDSTRAELDDRHLSKKARGQKFQKNVKGHMAMLMDKRFEAEPGEPSIVLLGPRDSRQVRQISMVKNDLRPSRLKRVDLAPIFAPMADASRAGHLASPGARFIRAPWGLFPFQEAALLSWDQLIP